MSKPLRVSRTILITLDAQDTLYKFKKPIATQYLEVARQYGVQSRIDEDALAVAFRTSFKAMSKSFPNYGHGTLDHPRTWWIRVVSDAFEHVIPKEEIPDALPGGLYDHFATAAAYDLYPDVKPFFETLGNLKKRHNNGDSSVFVGLISNSDSRVKSILEHLGLRVGTDTLYPHAEATQNNIATLYHAEDDIDFVTTSCAAKVEKPHRGIFEHAKAMMCGLEVSKRGQSVFDHATREESADRTLQGRQSELREQALSVKSECSTLIHIGDDYKKDYRGAKDAGWEAIYLNREGEATDVVNAVHTLTEAVHLIKLILDAR